MLGKVLRFLLAATLSYLSFGPTAFADTTATIVPPEGSELFGSEVVVLPNGNFVVTDPGHDTASARNAGSVSLHRPDGSLLSRLVGSSDDDQVGYFGIVVLANGNFVAASPRWNSRHGAATWIDGERGLDGEVSEVNSLVGDVPGAETGWFLIALANGNYLVSSTGRPGGAITWGDGFVGRRGRVGTDNSLVGSHPGDGVTHAVPLPNGNFVVVSPNWDNGTVADAGAVTFGDGTTGIVGQVSSTNSLVGSTAFDRIGVVSSNVYVLPNSNYVVSSGHWHDEAGAIDVGAVTWGSGTTGVAGPISAANSLVGNQAGDRVGTRVAALANGNYLVNSSRWNGGRGALTWCDGVGGCRGEVDSNISLMGVAPGDFLESRAHVLAGGHAAFATPRWDHPRGVPDVGAVTWIDGQRGLRDQLDGNGSLVGSAQGDNVGRRVVALASGNVVAASGSWDSDDAVDAGAVTWLAGDRAFRGTVSAENSFTGTSAHDQVGDQIFALNDDDYAIVSPGWSAAESSEIDIGAITYCRGGEVCPQADKTSPTPQNSLIGRVSGDMESVTITPLRGTQFVISNPRFDQGALSDAGAITWWDGPTGATLDETNSILGAHDGDKLGLGDEVVALPDGSYTVPAAVFGEDNEGAIIYGRRGTVLTGTVDDGNSVIGAAPNAGLWMQQDYDAQRRQLIVGDSKGNRVVLYRPGHETQTQIAAGAPLPGNPEPSITFGIVVTSPLSPPFGTTRVYASSGESCDGASEREITIPNAFGVYQECAISFASSGSRELRAEHFGDDVFGYSSSEPTIVTITVAPNIDPVFTDGFE